MKHSFALALVLVLGGTANAQLYGGQTQKQFSQTIDDGYSMLKLFGNLGPNTDRQSFGISRNVPEQCEVDKVVMLMRHGERYPDGKSAEKMLNVLDKVYKSNNSSFTGSLEFLNTWETHLTDPGLFEQETFSGPYNGLGSLYKRGAVFRERYGHLWDGEGLPIFTSGSQRVLDSARRFGQGFLGFNYSQKAYVNIIPEDGGQGANSLTPRCFVETNVTDVPYDKVRLPQFKEAARRLNSENPGLNLTAEDVHTLMQFGPYELNARHYTPWADVFTLDEWIAFRYMLDLSFFYGAGPGSNRSAPVGSVFANASLTVLNQDTDKGRLYFNFGHDSDLTPALTALGLVIPGYNLPFDEIDWWNPYKISDVVPMGGHIVIERLACNATAYSEKGTYVRTILNEAVVPYQNCQSGPGFSCPLSNYTKMLHDSLPDYTSACKVPKEYPQSLTFFWNYNKTTDFNYQKEDIGYQANLITWDGKPVDFDTSY
uniref:ARAD1B05324p n=1 Tax=Blastobotrys adeninivorans TaxID=409370 RepID=A0A060TA80_BLAAD